MKPSLVPASTAVPAAAGKQQNEKDNYEKRRGIHVRLPRNAAYCAAWNSGFLTTFRWSSGSRNARGEMAHSDALTSACLLSLKGSVASLWLCADDFRSSPTRRHFRARRASHLCRQETYAPQQLAARSITSSARASSEGGTVDQAPSAGCKLAAGSRARSAAATKRRATQKVPTVEPW